MKKLLAYSLLMALMICSCQVEEIKDDVIETEPETITEAKVFTAIIEDSTSGETKTALDGSGNVLWKLGDQVSIFAASTVNEQYQVSDDSDGKTAATLNKLGGSGFVAGTEIDNNVAFYPYASTASIAKSGGSYIISDIELPATQNYAEGSFGNGVFPMAAVTGSTGDMNLKFKNVLGGLKLQLKGTATITSITVTGNNNEILCGDAEVTVAYGSIPSINLTDASAKTVTLDCGAGVSLDSETATSFIIALPPMTITGGFTVVITDSESKQMEIATSKSQTITRSGLLKMPAVNYVGIAPIVPIPNGAVDLGLSVMWASCNLCENGFVSSPEEYGDYYSWGETTPKTEYNMSTYKWCNGSYNTLTKYNTRSSNGDVDNKTLLDWEDDAARVALGDKWRMPTFDEWKELFDNCSITWTIQNGVTGELITSRRNGNSIFLPAAGNKGGTNLTEEGSKGYYWLSSTSLDSDPCYFRFYSSTFGNSYGNRYNGHSIRPVYGDMIRVSNVELSFSSITMEAGSAAQLMATIYPSDAMVKTLIWSSSDENVASVDMNGYVVANTPGVTVISVTTGDGGYASTCAVTVTLGINATPESVDLGLPSGIKWASFNVGASSPEQYGKYFAWGETTTKTEYNPSTYKWSDGTCDTRTKYNYIKDVLDLEDDAARANWEGQWRMPTEAEWRELRANCTWTWITQCGVNGYRVVSQTNSNSIFLPAAGSRSSTSLVYVGSSGYYWSSTLDTDSDYSDDALSINLSSVVYYISRGATCNGLSVRPVTE